jgi:hypothetical protein
MSCSALALSSSLGVLPQEERIRREEVRGMR